LLGGNVVPFPRGRVGVQGAAGNVVTWGGLWDRTKVEDRLIEALRALPGRGIYSPARGRFEVRIGEKVDALALIEFAESALPRADYRLLIAWATCRLHGHSFAEWCSEAHLSPDICRKRRERAAAKLAKLLRGAPMTPELSRLTISVSARE
jgi:hypothetical protein